MTPERMAGLVARWVRLYTRNLPPPAAERRSDEIAADLHDHIAHERAEGTDDARIARGIAARMARGAAADLAWARSSTRKDKTTMSKTAYIRVAVATTLILLFLGVTQLAADGMNWGPGDFLLAAVLLGGAGLLLELVLSRPRGLVYRVAAVAVGLAAIVLGEMDDAPGLVGFGCLLIGTALLLSVRLRARARS
jgi:hypothetical protein